MVLQYSTAFLYISWDCLFTISILMAESDLLQMAGVGEMSVFVRDQVVTILANLATFTPFLHQEVRSRDRLVLPFLAAQLAAPLAAAATLAEKEATLRVMKKAAIALSRYEYTDEMFCKRQVQEIIRTTFSN